MGALDAPRGPEKPKQPNAAPNYLSKGPEKTPETKLNEEVGKVERKYRQEVINAKTYEDADKVVDKATIELNANLSKDPKLVAAIKEGSEKKYEGVFFWTEETGKYGCSYSTVIKNEGGKLMAKFYMRPWGRDVGEAP